ncbi:MAG TPA: SIS domain-containing protein [Candidatus Nitrosotalea sp.]|nr:SIS domain-containing protein [Candidatus Nitrosotalea sp.]
MIPKYFLELGDTMGRVEASDGRSRPLEYDEGIRRATEVVREQTAAGRKVIFVGNGGSAAIASHQAIDYWKNGGMRAIAFNDPALLTCVGNDFGYPHVFEKPIAMFADAGDVLIAISSGGRSENILRAVGAGITAGCRVLTMSGFLPDNPLRTLGEVNFYVPSDSYGYVEITHLAVCHCIVDTIIGHARPSRGGP